MLSPPCCVLVEMDSGIHAVTHLQPSHSLSSNTEQIPEF